ncbi:ABC transporter permease [Leptolyngbya sp. FACHB-261]|uniref:ABC transporter permease n=1 Tax=Leptolyngbya sp. FACHB-261 TaxID=2692806 RepID=UPI001689CE0F|nr:ABC transporter permease [Leptolyngbya sp. FACHB-261]MBD2103105.1 ABC transporter permease [Leptolyngbya sp. FACHB-261]
MKWSISPWGVYSVWRRHAKVYQNTWLVNFLPPVSEPLLYLIAFGYGLTPIVGKLNYHGQSLTYLQFIAPGMIAVGVLFQAFFEGAYGSFIRLNFQRTWQALLTAPLSFSDVFVGDWLWAATRGMIAALITGVVTVLLGFYPWSGLLVALPLLMLGALLFSAMGLLTAGLVQTIDQVNVPIFMLIVPMFTLCGTYFPRENLPWVLRTIASLLPLSPVVDLMRWPYGLALLWPLQILWLLVLMVVAAFLAWRQIRRKLFS